jgi:hypothetical protein
MVDFNNEATISTPALEVEKISILQRRYDFLEAYEDYKKKRLLNTPQPLSYATARLITLFLECRALLQRRLKKEEFIKLEKLIFTTPEREKDILEIFYIINTQLDEVQLTKIDTNKVYDSTKVETENKAKGY